MSSYMVFLAMATAVNAARDCSAEGSIDMYAIREYRFRPGLTEMEIRIGRNTPTGEGEWVVVDSTPIMDAFLGEFLSSDGD